MQAAPSYAVIWLLVSRQCETAERNNMLHTGELTAAPACSVSNLRLRLQGRYLAKSAGREREVTAATAQGPGRLPQRAHYQGGQSRLSSPDCYRALRP